ncbi:ribonuclease H family protein [Kordia algicida OT-1]|uniref:Ribonuclease H n=1 Tax=Kordia algicida OT-1 TaxID=391587 RepID=A9DXV7_9FLAO|nr:ribonuclease H family protein [Kordia algicida]EDP96052.1 ribonuclease H-related protein [Kordia algicida OT-1]
MSKKKKKYYVVWKGAKTGILESWEECKKSIHGFKGAEYKSFKTIELAKKAYSGNYNEYKGKTIFESTLTEGQIKLIGEPNLESVSVDAACSGNPGIVEYKCVETKTKDEIFYFGPLYESTNNIGEFLGLVHTLAHMKKVNDKRPIYTDSRIAMNWVKNKTCRTDLEKNDKNRKSFELIERAIKWLKTNKIENKILKWETKAWGEIPADFGRK